MFLARVLINAGGVALEIKAQQHYNQRYLVPLLHRLEQTYQGRFTKEQRQKILSYYGLFITAFLSSSFKRLTGKKLSEIERQRAAWFAILTPVGDDLSDLEGLDETALRLITLAPEQYQPQSFLAKVACQLQHQLMHSAPNPVLYKQASSDVLESQLASMEQEKGTLNSLQLLEITEQKGGASVWIYYLCLDEPLELAMKPGLMRIGANYQLGNDLFDVFKDLRDGIKTTVNTCVDFATFRAQFLEKVTEQNQLIRQWPFAKGRIQDFLVRINAINARSLVAIDHFLALENKLGTLRFETLHRSDLIVDMEKPGNWIAWFHNLKKINRI